MTNLSENFYEHEFQCKDKNGNPCPYCGGIVKADKILIRSLEELRKALGNREIIITCGHRCTKCNIDAGGEPDSQHLLGKAADIKVAGLKPAEVAKIAAIDIPSFKRGGIGVYASFTHVDVRGYMARWGMIFDHIEYDDVQKKLGKEVNKYDH